MLMHYLVVLVVLSDNGHGYVTKPAGTAADSVSQTNATMNDPADDRLRGRAIRWTFDYGPTAGITFEHVFREDGKVEWTALSGPMEGTSAVETEYAVV